MAPRLEIRDLHTSIGDQQILKGLSLKINPGEFHAIMGPNGSGKSTLANTIMGHPHYEVTAGDILVDGESILELEPNERAAKGVFLAFQYPLEIPGVSMANFLRTAANALRGEEVDILEFQDELERRLEQVKMDAAFAGRSLNEGFSGGEKKKAEMVQMAVLKPKIAVMDETDSGLDIDALKTVAEVVNDMRDGNFSALIITHYKRILNYIKPDFVHIMVDGRIAMSGGPELADELEEKGYEWVRSQVG
ncbi:MAG TPA: Fe-S cluster assembly ATPase SufC [Bacillota bacterium]